MVTIPLFMGLKNHPNLVVQDFATIHSIMEIAMLPCIICRWRMLVHGWWPPWMPRKKHGETMVRFQPESTWINQRSAKLSGFLDISAISWCHDVPWPVGQIPSTVPLMPWVGKLGKPTSGSPPRSPVPDQDRKFHRATLHAFREYLGTLARVRHGG